MNTNQGGPADPAPFPERIGRYEILLPIASGGMATVYLARATGVAGFEREVALKLTHSHLREQAGFATSLIDEARLAGRIRDPNVVSVLDVGEDPHGVFLVMEYVEGDTLAGLERVMEESGARVPESLCVRIADDLLAGLHAAHELRDEAGRLLGLVHRDVTPHNVLVGTDGTCKLTDFGIAKAATRLGVTATGLVKGKVAYMSPEQALGKPLDRTCDIWAAGVVLWELLAGMRLHTAASDAATLLRIVSEPPPRLRAVRPDLAPELDEVVARALQMDRRHRYATAEEFARTLEAAARSSCGRAERREVGIWAKRLVAERLARRRARVAEVMELRGRLSRITHRSLASRPGGTPSSQPALSAELVSALAREAAPGAPASFTGAPGAVEPPVPGPAPEPAPHEPTGTETISVATARGGLPERGASRRVVILAGAAAVVAGAVGLAVFMPGRGATGTASAMPASIVPPPLSSAPVARASSIAPEAPALTPDDLPLAAGSDAGARAGTHGTGAHGAGTAQRAARSGAVAPERVSLDPDPATSAGGLLTNPYRKRR